jgi:hypothetical protein
MTSIDNEFLLKTKALTMPSGQNEGIANAFTLH